MKLKGDNTYKLMNDWLGSRWMKEMDSIKVLIEVIKHAIENKEKVKNELVLQQEDFFIDDVRLNSIFKSIYLLLLYIN